MGRSAFGRREKTEARRRGKSEKQPGSGKDRPCRHCTKHRALCPHIESEYRRRARESIQLGQVRAISSPQDGARYCARHCARERGRRSEGFDGEGHWVIYPLMC